MHKATVLIPGRAGVWISVSDSRNLCLSSELEWPLQLEPPSPTEERALPPLLLTPHHWVPHFPLCSLGLTIPQIWPHLHPCFEYIYSQPAFPPVLWEPYPVAWKQGRNPGSQKKMSCCYSTVIHTCSYRPFYRWLAVFTGYWLGIGDCYSFSLYSQIRVGGTLSHYLV